LALPFDGTIDDFVGDPAAPGISFQLESWTQPQIYYSHDDLNASSAFRGDITCICTLRSLERLGPGRYALRIARSSSTDFADAARTIAEQCSCLRSRRISRILTRLYDDALRPTGLRVSQLTVLVALARFGPKGAKLGRIADVLAMERTTMTRNIGPLESAGLLRVARDPDDARARILVLTRAGERAIEAAFPLWQAAQRQVRSAVGGGRLDEVHEQMTELLSAISAPRGPARTSPRARKSAS
jgi:DNA-binding MarR family transcriptional regulator